MSVQLGQVAAVAAIAALVASARKKKLAALAAGVLLSSITFAANPVTVDLGKFTPTVPNPNKAQAHAIRCLDLQLKLNLAFLNFKIPTLDLSFALPKIPLDFLNWLQINIDQYLKCVMEMLALIALARALLADMDDDTEAVAAAKEEMAAYKQGQAKVAAANTSIPANTETTYYNTAFLNAVNAQAAAANTA